MTYVIEHLLTPIILVVSVVAAFLGIRNAREISRKKATIDLIDRFESTAFYQKINSTFSYYRNTDSFHRLHNPIEPKEKSERREVLDFLNHYELVAIGIEQRVLDEQMYKYWMCGPMVRDWNAAADFIQRERWKYDKIKCDWSYYEKSYENYERISHRLSPDAKKIGKDYSPPPTGPAGPGDEFIPKSKKEG